MKHRGWQIAATFVAVIVAAGCLLVPLACADDEDDDIRSEEFNVEGAYFHWLETAPNDVVSAVSYLENEITNYVLYEMYGEAGEAMFAEILALKAGLPSTGVQFNDMQERGIAALAELSTEQITGLYNLWNYMKEMYEFWEENYEKEYAAVSEGETSAAATELMSEEDVKKLGDFLAARSTGENERQQEDLAEWFLSLSTDDQSAAMTYLGNTLSDEEYDAFWTWFMQAYMANCSSGSATASDTLNLHGKNWAELTLPGLPAPAQGNMQLSAAVDNKRTGRKIVLAQVEQTTINDWLTEISNGSGDAAEDYGLVEERDHDGSAFDQNFGPSSTAEGGYTTYFVSEDDGDDETNPTEVKIEYDPVEKTLTISVLDP